MALGKTLFWVGLLTGIFVWPMLLVALLGAVIDLGDAIFEPDLDEEGLD